MTPPHTKEWALRLDIYEEGDTTRAHARLDTHDNVLEAVAEARRNPHDRAVPEIGDEIAAGRAMIALGERLVRAGASDVEAAISAPRAR
ncbi:hypothetical protein CK485_05790 [Streptomyces sp. ICBB 8177]|nr:hypothetical protein CK485_05790 [Streptomyces sp. ICBB 8177]